MFGMWDRIRRLKKENALLRKELRDLHDRLRQIAETGQLVEKAFRVAGCWGDYVEFGAYKGDSLAQAYHACKRIVNELVSGQWDHSFDRPQQQRASFEKAWREMRFIAFDSFEGMPKPGRIDSICETFPEGTYRCSESDFLSNLRIRGVDLQKVKTVKGFFQDTLNEATARQLNLQRAAVVHIDSDLYESAELAMRFITPYLMDGSVLIFDDWYQFRGNPNLGEQRAFRAWRAGHPELVVSEFQKEGAYRNSFIVSKHAVPDPPAT